MEPFFWGYPLWLATVPLVLLLVSVLLAWMAFFALGKLVGRRGPETGPTLSGAILSSLRSALPVVIVLMGIYLAVLASPYIGTVYQYVAGALPVLLALLSLYVAVALLSGVLGWYGAEITARARSRVHYIVVPLLRIALPLGGVLIAVLLVLEAMGIRVAPISAWLLAHGGRMALIVVLALVLLLAAEEAVPRMVDTSLSRRPEEHEEEAKKRADTLARTLVTGSQIAAVVTASFMVIAEFGLNIGPLLAGVGIAGIAIGFGTQSLVRDLVGGFFVIVENQYRIGDVIKVGEVAGLVEDVSLRRTVLRDLDGIVHSVPNGEVRISSNFTREWSRVNLNVAVAYREDPDKVIGLLNKVGRSLAQDPAWAPLVLTPPQAVGIDYFGDGSFEVKVLGETRPIRQWDVMRELRRRIKKLFDQEGIELKPSQQGLVRQLALPQRPRHGRGRLPRHRGPRTGPGTSEDNGPPEAGGETGGRTIA